MSRGVFVTGTDTAVGKTVAACALIYALRIRGIDVMPMKPIAAGAVAHAGGWANEDSLALLRAAGKDASRLADVTPILLVGGFEVPLGDRLDTVDLARAIGLPVVLVVGLRLGCLNHALLTARAIRASGLAFAGWIANAIDPAMAVAGENVAALEHRLEAPLIARLPFQARPDAATLAESIALDALLRTF